MRNGLPKPTPDDLEAFAERVAIKLADMGDMDEQRFIAIARLSAAMEWESRKTILRP